MSDPTIEELRNDAARQRQAIAEDLELVGDRVSPGRVADRQKARWRGRVERARDSVFGSPDRRRSYARQLEDLDAASDDASLRDRAGGAVQQARESTPDSVTEFTEGHPLAAGVIGFGAGLLAAALIPSTREEERLGQRVQGQLDQTAAEVGRTGREAAENVKPAAQEAAQNVKESAKGSAQSVKGDARSSAEEVRDHAKDRASDVRKS